MASPRIKPEVIRNDCEWRMGTVWKRRGEESGIVTEGTAFSQMKNRHKWRKFAKSTHACPAGQRTGLGTGLAAGAGWASFSIRRVMRMSPLWTTMT